MFGIILNNFNKCNWLLKFVYWSKLFSLFIFRNSTGVLAVASGVNFTEVLNKIPEHVKNNLKA